MGDVWVGVVWAFSVISVWLSGQICAGEWCYENVRSCEVEKVASCDFLHPRNLITSSSAIAEKPRCSVGQFWVAITPYSADRPISIKSNQIEITD